MRRHSVILILIELKIMSPIFSAKLKLFRVTTPLPTHPGPLTLEEIAAVQTNIDEDALTKAIGAAEKRCQIKW